MKRIFWLSILLQATISALGHDTITATQLILRSTDDVNYTGYKKGDSVPFTGYVIAPSERGVQYINGQALADTTPEVPVVLRADTSYYLNGAIRLIQHFDTTGHLSGSCLYYDSLGALTAHGEFFNGLKDGCWSYYQKGKTKKVGSYINGVKNSWWVEFDENGNAIKRDFYVWGELRDPFGVK